MQSRMLWSALCMCGLMLAGCEKKGGKPDPEHNSRAVLSYLARPAWAGERFETQILGPEADFRLYDLTDGKEGTIYVAIDAAEPERVAQKFLKDLKLVEWAQVSEDGKEMRLGKLVFPREKPNFRTPASNFTVSPEKVLTFEYRQATLSLTVSELVRSLDNEWSYGGYLEAVSERYSANYVAVFINHGPYVQKRGEPALSRFVQDLLKTLPKGEQAPRESRIQCLLDFAANQIEYDYDQAELSVQKLERPIETLMRGKTTCGNKSILLASLLEQIGEEYVLAYFPHHLTVAVEQGNFPNLNGYAFRYGGKVWIIAEPTCPGFQTGRSVLETPLDADRMEYIQRPSELNVIYNAKTGKRVELLQ